MYLMMMYDREPIVPSLDHIGKAIREMLPGTGAQLDQKQALA